jgi:hypothetical protein
MSFDEHLVEVVYVSVSHERYILILAFNGGTGKLCYINSIPSTTERKNTVP